MSYQDKLDGMTESELRQESLRQAELVIHYGEIVIWLMFASLVLGVTCIVLSIIF